MKDYYIEQLVKRKNRNLEYEYVFYNGSIDVDKIVAKKFRKRLISTDLHAVEVIAPTGSLEVQQYRKLKKYL